MPDDSWFDNIDPLQRRYMYEHWSRDEEQQYELLKSQAILIGSFTNPDAAKAMLKAETPDFESSNEDFDKSLEMVLADREKNKPVKKKKRQRLKRETK